MTRPPIAARYRLPAPSPRPIEPVEVAGLVTTLRGRRLVLVNDDGPHYGWIAWQDEFDQVGGFPHVRAVAERDWFRYEEGGRPPARIIRWPAAAAWVEM